MQMVQSGRNKWRKHQNRGLKSCYVFCTVFFVFQLDHVASLKSKLSILSIVLYGITCKKIIFTLLSVLVKMGKIGRRRKYTHRKYENSQPTGNQQTSSSPVLRSCQQPTEYQFPLHTFLLVFCTSPHFTTTRKCSQFCVKVMTWKTIGI